MKKIQNFCTDIIGKSIWKPASVTQEPHTILTKWRVYSVIAPLSGNYDTTIHFVGNTGSEGRVCSPVLEYDGATKRGITFSGRIYELSGESGFDSDASYVWGHWCEGVKPTVIKDITEQY